MATGLKRVTLQPAAQVSEETKKIARQAQAVLKYDDLAMSLDLPTETLTVVLERLKIRPFERDSVTRYKEAARDRVKKRTGGYHYWNKRPIADSSNVPLFVLRKAIQIKLASPTVRLFVESLEKDPDPFLIASLGKEEYYIEVWDEKDFEATL